MTYAQKMEKDRVIKENFESWVDMVKDCRSYGGAITTWCKRNDIDYASYHEKERYVLLELVNEHLAMRNYGPKAETELKVVKSEPVKESAPIKVTFGNSTLELPPNLPTESLVAIITALNHAA